MFTLQAVIHSVNTLFAFLIQELTIALNAQEQIPYTMDMNYQGKTKLL